MFGFFSKDFLNFFEIFFWIFLEFFLKIKKNGFLRFSPNWPTGPIRSSSCDVCLSVCLSVSVSDVQSQCIFFSRPLDGSYIT